jgi:hypothetical protein
MKKLEKLFLILTIITIFNQVNGKLLCEQDPNREIYYGRSLNIQDCRISSIVQEDFYRINKIYGWGNLIRKLEDNIFSSTDELVHLDFHLNSISEISVGAFSGLHSLKTLFLQKNNITRLEEGLFDDLNDLEELNLDNNQIRTLQGNLFDNNPNLGKIYLSYNYILSIQPHIFDNLESLRILNFAENICVRFNFLIENRNNSLIYLIQNAPQGYPITEEHWLKGCLENHKFHNQLVIEHEHEKTVVMAISGTLLIILVISNAICCGVLCYHYKSRDDSVEFTSFFPIYARSKPKRTLVPQTDPKEPREVFKPAVQKTKPPPNPKPQPKQRENEIEDVKDPVYEEVTITHSVDLIPKKPIRKMPTIP